MIYNPTEEYENRLRETHAEKVRTYFERLVKESGVDVEENRKTRELYYKYKEDLEKLKKSLNLWRFLRVLMCISLVLIPVVVTKTTPKIRGIREDIEQADDKAEQLITEAEKQMAPLNSLFSDNDGLALVQETIPQLKFDECFTAEKESDMQTNYDFVAHGNDDESTLEVLSGEYNGNPFLFENKLVHTMGTETYHGSLLITWTETYRDNNGNLQTRHRSQTLHASVVKPKPYYSTRVVLSYGSQGAPELSFSRDATHLDRKSEKAIERYVKKGEKKLKRMTDKAIEQNDDFTSMSNSEFEVLFDALDRTDEVQFRTLFTPLAQTNMVELLLSKTGYGDDFNFIKTNRMNKIISSHSQGRGIILPANSYESCFFEEIQNSFINKNAEFFKAVYFDFAPLWAIPAYQERPVHSLKPVPDYLQMYSLKECESLANIIDRNYVVHPDTGTEAILKSEYVGTKDNADETCITAYSYGLAGRVDYIPTLGGDGRIHSVPVPWDEYIPLVLCNNFFVARQENVNKNDIMASRNGLCIFR